MAEGYARAETQSFVPLASSTLILASLTVAAGRGIRGEPVTTPRILTGGVVILFGIMGIGAIDQLLAATFSLLVFLVCFLQYGPDILGYIGFNISTDGQG